MAHGNDGPIEREIRIKASPETIFSFLIEPDKLVQWMGQTAKLDPHPGGLYWLDYNGSDIMRGEFKEIEQDKRLVISWGWETVGAVTLPGSTIVEFTLVPDGDTTLLRMVHRDLVGDEITSHAEGWDYFLSRLNDVASTGSVVATS